MTTVVPPRGDLVRTLSGIHSLITASKWERAAIVHAYCQPEPGARSDLGRTGPRFTFSEFAELGISGLTKRHSVARYYHAWQKAVDAGKARALEPGDTIEVPDAAFPASAPPPLRASVSVSPAAALARPRHRPAPRVHVTPDDMRSYPPALTQNMTAPPTRDPSPEQRRSEGVWRAAQGASYLRNAVRELTDVGGPLDDDLRERLAKALESAEASVAELRQLVPVAA